MHIKKSFITGNRFFNLIFSGAISRFQLYLFGKETAKKDAASIGAIVYDLKSLPREGLQRKSFFDHALSVIKKDCSVKPGPLFADTPKIN
jgi:hypothetical protein